MRRDTSNPDRPSVRDLCVKHVLKQGETTEYTEAHGRNDVGHRDPAGSARSVYSVYSVVQSVKPLRRRCRWMPRPFGSLRIDHDVHDKIEPCRSAPRRAWGQSDFGVLPRRWPRGRRGQQSTPTPFLMELRSLFEKQMNRIHLPWDERMWPHRTYVARHREGYLVR